MIQSFVKDPNTGAVINNDDREYKNILLARAAAKKSNEMERRIQKMELEIKELRKLIKEAINRAQ